MHRQAFTRRLRLRLTQVAHILGMPNDAFAAKRYSGISYHKGAFSTM